MSLRPRLQVRAYLLGFLIVLGTGASCRSPTAPELVEIAVDFVPLATESDFRGWPFTPTIAGGEAIVIRGMVSVGCGNFEATAFRVGRAVSVEVTSDSSGQFCIAIYPQWRAFTASLAGLAPAEYRVTAKVTGHDGRADFTVPVIE